MVACSRRLAPCADVVLRDCSRHDVPAVAIHVLFQRSSRAFPVGAAE